MAFDAILCAARAREIRSAFCRAFSTISGVLAEYLHVHAHVSACIRRVASQRVRKLVRSTNSQRVLANRGHALVTVTAHNMQATRLAKEVRQC